MKHNKIKFNKILFFLIPMLVVLFAGCVKVRTPEEKYFSENGNAVQKSDAQKADENSQGMAVASPPFSEGIYPCSVCHSKIKVNTEKRELKYHTEISKIFNHDKENRWCLDCHSDNTRDSLRLASGKLLDFRKSYLLCGQCHGDKLRDWKVGVHGKRTGEWNGKKKYLLCVNCHNPHSPKFKQLKPEPPPVRQENIRY